MRRGSGQVDIHVGRFFTDEESHRRMPVAVIGADIEKGLFANLDPIGKTITVDGHEFTVIGTMLRPAASFFGDTDSRVLLPYGTMQKMYPNARENAIVVTAINGRLPQALDEVRTVLRIDRRVPYDKPDTFALSTAEQMVSDFRQITSMTFLVMVVLSSIGLLVGGIGVMNIMLVSVTERTYEIGIRKALGARKFDILVQFLIEAAALTGIGGIIGIMFGWAISMVARLVFSSLPATVPLWAAATGHRGVRGRRPVLRHLAGEQSGAPRSRSGAAVRVTTHPSRDLRDAVSRPILHRHRHARLRAAPCPRGFRWGPRRLPRPAECAR